jgi:ribose transport system permease protein
MTDVLRVVSVRGWRRRRGTGVPWLQIAAAVMLFALEILVIPGFGRWSSVTAILVLASLMGIASAGQTLAALLGGLDLSIPVVIGMANVAICQLTGGSGMPFGLAALLVLTVAGAIGGASGFVSRRFAIHPLLVTIGTASLVTGAVRAVGPEGGRAATAAAPSWLTDFTSPGASTIFVPLPPVVVLWVVVAVGLTLLLTRTAFGRQVYATGANPRAAELADVHTTRTWSLTFALGAVFAAVAGILLAGFTGEGVFSVGAPYLFQTIACVVVGGTSLLGGRGDYGRTVIGALILTELTTLFSGLGFDASTQQVVLGLLMLAVVAGYGREAHIRNRI